ENYTAAWDFGDGSPHGTGDAVKHTYRQPGDYDVTLTISRDATVLGSATKKITVLPDTISITGPDSVCSTNSFITQYFTSSTFGADYKWSVMNGTVRGPDNLSYAGVDWKNVNNDSGVVRVEMSVNEVCTISATRKVIVLQRPVLTWQLKDSICITDAPLELSADPQGGFFRGTGISGNLFMPNAAGAGTHQLTYRYGEGLCAAEIQKTIRVTGLCSTVPSPLAPVGSGMPTAFTPNGDGLNDVFRIPAGLISSLEQFTVYSRWGEKVFITRNVAAGWDGTIRQTAAHPGVYIYIISGKDENGRVVVWKGTVMLLR
ncbi:MAG TPA: gliding motility-associated C-terminal domain-containing protein, partial [Agriterribacter sp.]|nr:gliding motility-associated C-terminal domain-containing protein [Agriterribacter sp.]